MQIFLVLIDSSSSEQGQVLQSNINIFIGLTGWLFITPRLAGYCEWKDRKYDIERPDHFYVFKSVELKREATVSKMETAQEESDRAVKRGDNYALS